MTPPKKPLVYERLCVHIPLYTDVFRFKYMFNVSIREYFSVLNVFIVCIRNTTVFKLIPLVCTHVYSYMFSTVHPPSNYDVGGMRWRGYGEKGFVVELGNGVLEWRGFSCEASGMCGMNSTSLPRNKTFLSTFFFFFWGIY